MKIECGNEARDLLHMVVSSITVDAQFVKVSKTVRNEEVTLTVFIPESDFARMSENGGRTFHALDTVFAGMAKRDRIKINLEVVASLAPTSVCSLPAALCLAGNLVAQVPAGTRPPGSF